MDWSGLVNRGQAVLRFFAPAMWDNKVNVCAHGYNRMLTAQNNRTAEQQNNRTQNTEQQNNRTADEQP